MTPAWIDDFDGSQLGPAWTDAYLPPWSSRASARASYEVVNSCIRLSIPPDRCLWCPDTHTPPIRVSGIQSGNWSGPSGSHRGQQPFREGLEVREEQREHWGWTPLGGSIDVRARMNLRTRSMASVWLIGRETEPAECAEICVFEIFGKDISGPYVNIGMGLHAFRDPNVAEDFEQVPLQIDPCEWHTYSIRWERDQVTFSVDGAEQKIATRPPWYPMQMEVAVFDFPEWGTNEDGHHVPWLEIDWIRHTTL